MNVDEVRRKLKLLAQEIDFEGIRSRGTEEMAPVLERADDVLRGVFSFTKTWDMERCAEKYQLEEPIDWHAHPNGDEEWCFMLNRMDYLQDLALAWAYTGDTRYARRAAELIRSWLAAHPHIEFSLSTRTLDTGIRMLATVQALPYLLTADELGGSDLSALVASLNEQMAYERAQYIPKYETSNWGSIQTLAIVAIEQLLSDDPETDDVYRWAYERARVQLRAQVYPDGVDWELSTMYHVEVLIYILNAIWSFERRGTQAPAFMRDAAAEMSHVLMMQMTSDGQIDCWGDSDRADVRGLLATCAAILSDGRLKVASGLERVPAADAYQFGARLECAYADVEKVPLDETTFDGVDSGLYTARSSWARDANQTFFVNGPMGSGHGHADNLHVSVYCQGHPVFIDSGRFTYREDDPRRPQFKAAPAHNVPLVDGRSSSVPKDSWGYASFGVPLKTYSRHRGDLHYWEGAFVGHGPVEVLVRKLMFIDRGLWLVCDEAWCEGDHELSARFHVDPTASLAPGGGEGPWRVETPAGSLAFRSTGTLSAERGRCSLEYNQLSEQDVLTARTNFTDHGVLIFSLCAPGMACASAPLYRNGDVPVDESLAHAFCFEAGPDEAYSVAVFHGEAYSGVKAFSLGGVSFHAKVAVVHRVGDRRELTVLRA